MREEDLIEQLAALMDKIDLDEIGMKQKIKDEIERHKKFNTDILGVTGRSAKVADVDIRNYAKYILREGTIWEKREMLACLKSDVKMNNKEVTLI